MKIKERVRSDEVSKKMDDTNCPKPECSDACNAPLGNTTPEAMCANCYRVRTFDRFLEWFGLIAVRREKSLLERNRDKVMITEVFESVFRFDM